MEKKTKKEKSNNAELKALLEQSASLQAKENDTDGIKPQYLLLAKAGTKALQKTQKELYIKGLKIGDVFLQKEKQILGERVKVVPLAFVTLYQEKESRSKDAQFFGAWNKEQAVSFPLADGSYFDRIMPNGHILQPINWVFCELPDFPELDKAVIAFKSTGSRIWKKWKEDAKERSQTSATLVYEVFEEAYSNADYEWTDFGFEYVENLIEKNKSLAIKCLQKSNAIREDYQNATLIANRSLPVTTGKNNAKQIEDFSETEDSEDEEDFEF